jgi:hypothetical protein
MKIACKLIVRGLSMEAVLRKCSIVRMFADLAPSCPFCAQGCGVLMPPAEQGAAGKGAVSASAPVYYDE